MAAVKAKKTINTNRKMFLFTLLVLTGDLAFIFFTKYHGSQISFSDFRLMNLGNILNIIFYLFPVAGLIILYLKPGLMNRKRYYLLYMFIILLNTPLLIFALATRIDISLPFTYLFSYQIEKIYNLSLLLIYQFILIFLGFVIWLTILKKERHFYLYCSWYSIITIIILVLFTIIYSAQISDKHTVQYTKNEKGDVAVILGAAVWSKDKPSPIFASRIGKATNLYNGGIVKKLQVTGGNAPGEISEAKVAYNVLLRYGVQKNDIWIEENTSSTYDQIAFIRKNLVAEKKLEKIIIVTDQFHLKRVMEICAFFNIKAQGVASDLKLSWEKSWFYRFRDSVALLLFWLFAF